MVGGGTAAVGLQPYLTTIRWMRLRAVCPALSATTARYSTSVPAGSPSHGSRPPAPLRYLFGERDESSAAAGQMARASSVNAAASLVAGGVSSATS